MRPSMALRSRNIDEIKNFRWLGSGERGEFAAILEFVAACFTLSSLNSKFATIAGEPEVSERHVAQALDQCIPVLEKLGDTVESSLDEFVVWNVNAAGRNQAITAEIDRNWDLLNRVAREQYSGQEI